MAITITNDKTINLTLNTKFKIKLTAKGGTKPYSWSTKSNLPNGITLTSKGILKGSAKEAGTFKKIVIIAKDSSGEKAKKRFKIVVFSPPSPKNAPNYFLMSNYGGEDISSLNKSYTGFYSSDAITWTKTELPNSVNANGTAYGNNVYIVVDKFSKSVYFSFDCEKWESSSLPPSFNFDNEKNLFATPLFANNSFYILSFDGSQYATSKDGMNWTGGATGFTVKNPGHVISGTYGLGKVIFCSTSGEIITTIDEGKNWTINEVIAASEPRNQAWAGIAFGNGKFVMVENGGYASREPLKSYWAFSENGISWNFGFLPDRGGWNGVIYNGYSQIFIATAYSQTIDPEPIGLLAQIEHDDNWDEFSSWSVNESLLIYYASKSPNSIRIQPYGNKKALIAINNLSGSSEILVGENGGVYWTKETFNESVVEGLWSAASKIYSI